MDISDWKGKSLTLQVDKLAETSSALKSIEQSDELKRAITCTTSLFAVSFISHLVADGTTIPTAWFTSKASTIFSFNTIRTVGRGAICTGGHAVSKDLVHWQEIRDQLLPDAMGPMFSGSAVVDWNNTSGLGRKDNPPLVLIYTAAGNPTVQAIAYSTDGRTFTKYRNNPVLKQITPGNRDPKVIWHQPSNQWVMVLYVELQGKHTVHFLPRPICLTGLWPV